MTWETIMPITARFAAVRRPTVGDFFIASMSPCMPVTLFSRLVTIDDESITPEQAAQLDMEDAAQVIDHVSQLLVAFQKAATP
jgi:hypothetical protein